MLQHQYIDGNSEVDNAATTTVTVLQRGRTAKTSHADSIRNIYTYIEHFCNVSMGTEMHS
jgi:hypothetical protein